jgi:hypothetical protein
MHKRFKSLRNLTVIMLFLTACGTWVVQAQPEAQATPKVVLYQTLLGKSVRDKEVVNFMVGNNCSSTGQFQVCKEVGMVLWTDTSQVVKTVYLYSGYADGFRRYRGELPFGLTFYDPMWRVEETLSVREADEVLKTTGQAGLPDEGSSPDHMHYWAVYKRFDLVVIYDSPVADEDAYIYAVLVNH